MPFTVLDPTTQAAAPTTSAGTPLTSVGETLSTIRAETLAQLLNRTDVAPGGDYTRLDRWINWGYINLAQMLDLKELWASVALSTVANQPLYGVPVQLSWIKRIMVDDPTFFVMNGGRELELIDEPTYRTLPDSDELLEGSPFIPTRYFRFARTLVLWPTPDDVYDLAIDFRVRPKHLTNPTDSPILPEEFHEALIYAALQRAWTALQNPQKAMIAQNQALAIVRPLMDTDGEEDNAMHAVMRPVTSKSQLYRSR